MTTLATLRALLFAGELLAGSTLVLGLAWFATARQTASARHLVWACALGASLALPLLAALLPSATHILLPAPAPIPLALNDAAFTAPPPESGGFAFDMSALALALGGMWLAGVCAVMLRLAVSAVCLALLKRRSRVYALAPADEPKVTAAAQECELRLCDDETGPISWGVFRPVILLPHNAVSWPRERLQAVLLHELAHIRRRDSLVQVLAQLACAFYWPNPLVWLAAARLRREAEIAADDAAIVAGLKPSAYAGELLELAEEFREHTFSNFAFSMAAPSALEARVESLLSPTNIRSGVTSMDVVKIAGVGLFAASAIAFACPSLAQETQAPVTTTELPAPPPAVPAVSAVPAMPAVAANPAIPPVAAIPASPADPATPATPVTSAVAASPADPATPATPATPADAAEPAEKTVRVWTVDGHDGDKMSAADRKHIRIVIEKARHEAREAVEKARPEIEKAMRQARAGEQALRDAQPQIDAAMAEVAKHRADIEKAMADVQPQIDAALAKARAELAKEHLDVKIEERIDAAMKRAEIRIETQRAKNEGREDRSEQSTVTTDGK